ncbi:MAG: PIN domain-containing protein [bacterium]|nr:PIN domain-containing protein [bacterium]
MQSPTKYPYLLLDTCIIEYLLDKYQQPAVTQQISEWAGDSFDLAISEITYAELVDGAFKEKIEKVTRLLDSYTRFWVLKEILRAAGIISNVYRTQGNSTVGSSLSDKVIAATAFSYNLPVITADVNDFPYPFFTSDASENIKYRKKNKDHYIAISILKPNVTILNYWFSKTK